MCRKGNGEVPYAPTADKALALKGFGSPTQKSVLRTSRTLSAARSHDKGHACQMLTRHRLHGRMQIVHRRLGEAPHVTLVAGVAPEPGGSLAPAIQNRFHIVARNPSGQ